MFLVLTWRGGACNDIRIALEARRLVSRDDSRLHDSIDAYYQQTGPKMVAGLELVGVASVITGLTPVNR